MSHLPDRSPFAPRAVLPWMVASLLPLALAAVTLGAHSWAPGWRAGFVAMGFGGSAAIAGWGTWHIGKAWTNITMLIGALREGDYGHRGARLPVSDAMHAMVADINALADTLRDGRRQRTEAVRFQGKMMAALQSPVFVVDQRQRLSMINPSARDLFDLGEAVAVGRGVAELGLAPLLALQDNVVHTAAFSGKTGRWLVRRAMWISGGREHTLIILHDVSAALGEEERLAWQRLIRVLSHELNNSLTPIGSVVDSLLRMLDNEGMAGVEGELRVGLDAIGRRAVLLARFLSGYGELGRLPPLHRRGFRLDEALRRLARLESRVPVIVIGNADIMFDGDEAQLDQAILNLLRNAAEASLPEGGKVYLHWATVGRQVSITVEDDGVGLPGSGSLFVPFFTTKPTHSGIGLTLSRLIVEAHGGTLDLQPRKESRGAIAIVLLPATP